MFSFPVRSHGDGKYEIVQGVDLSEYARKKIADTTKELLEERELVKELLVR